MLQFLRLGTIASPYQGSGESKSTWHTCQHVCYFGTQLSSNIDQRSAQGCKSRSQNTELLELSVQILWFGTYW